MIAGIRFSIKGVAHFMPWHAITEILKHEGGWTICMGKYSYIVSEFVCCTDVPDTLANMEALHAATS